MAVARLAVVVMLLVNNAQMPHFISRRRRDCSDKGAQQEDSTSGRVGSESGGGGVVPSEEQRQKLARKPALLAELKEVRRKESQEGLEWPDGTRPELDSNVCLFRNARLHTPPSWFGLNFVLFVVF